MSRAFLHVILGLCLGWLLGIGPAQAADWTQWRGPNRDGHADGFLVPGVWPAKLKQLWKVEVGEGHASPIVVGDRVFAFSREGDKEVVRVMNLSDGKEQWSQSYTAPYSPSPYAASHGKGPKSTPVVAEGRLITVGISSIVSCWDTASGRLLWQQDFSKKFKEPSSLFYGMAVSPLVVGKRVVAHVGVSGDGALVALDLDAGKVHWKWDAEGPGYASPILATLGGTRQLLTQSQAACIGVSPDDGQLLWSIPFKTEYDQDIITPVKAGNTVIFAGLAKPTAAYSVGKIDGKPTPEQVWSNKDLSLYMSSPVLVDGYLYGLANRSKGQFFCLDALTGKTMWTSEGRMGENAALLAAGKVLLALTTDSQLTVFKADPVRFTQVASYKVADTATWAHHAAVGNEILIKDKRSLAVWTTD